MQQAGLPAVQSFNMSMISLALGMVGTMGSWFLMSKLGRRTIHFSGACTLFTILIIGGSLSFAGNEASLWAIGAILIVFVFVYDFTIGPITYSIVSEMSSTRLKAKTIVLARAFYNISNIVVNVLTNYQLGELSWNWGAKTAYFWAEPAVVSAFGSTSACRNPRAGPTENWTCYSSNVSLQGSLRAQRSTRLDMGTM
jgi:SP family general alpha glucoside:H+ symporter-like MFS transporter